MGIKLSNTVFYALIISYVLSVEEQSILVPYYNIINHTPNMMAYVRITSVTYMPDSKWDHVRSISMGKMLANCQALFNIAKFCCCTICFETFYGL